MTTGPEAVDPAPRRPEQEQLPGFDVRLSGLTMRYGRAIAVDGISVDFRAGAIHGLLGRNASGKTTLLSALASFRKPHLGRILIDGEAPFENERIMEGTCLVREGGDLLGSESVRASLRVAADLRPAWSQPLAERLLDRFEIPMRKTADSLSRGKRSALGVVIGLASRAPLTMFDETYLGMDAPTRYAFYDELLADYTSHPRTFILSGHLISELERLFEYVTIIDRGRLLLSDELDALRERGTRAVGPEEAVDEFSANRKVIGQRSLGHTKEVTLFEELDEAERRRGLELGLEFGAISLQDLFVQLTGSRR